MPRVTRRRGGYATGLKLPSGIVPLGADPRSWGPAFYNMPKEAQQQRLAEFHSRYPEMMARGGGILDKIRKLDQDFGNFLLRNLKKIPIPGVADIVPRIVKKIEGEDVYRSRPIPHVEDRPIKDVVADIIPWISTVAEVTKPTPSHAPAIRDRPHSRVIVEELPDDYPLLPSTQRLAITAPPKKPRKLNPYFERGAGLRKKWIADALAQGNVAAAHGDTSRGKGAFTRKAKAAGMPVHAFANYVMKHKGEFDQLTRKQASLALNLENISAHRRGKPLRGGALLRTER